MIKSDLNIYTLMSDFKKREENKWGDFLRRKFYLIINLYKKTKMQKGKNPVFYTLFRYKVEFF